MSPPPHFFSLSTPALNLHVAKCLQITIHLILCYKYCTWIVYWISKWNLSLSEKCLKNYLFLTKKEVSMGQSWPRLWVQAKCSEVCTHSQGQDSHADRLSSVTKKLICLMKVVHINCHFALFTIFSLQVYWRFHLQFSEGSSQCTWNFFIAKYNLSWQQSRSEI